MSIGTAFLGDIMIEKQKSIDPKKIPKANFALYSIPGFDAGEPEICMGDAIGSTKKCLEPGDVVLSRIIPHIRRAWVVGDHDVDHIVGSSEWIVFRSPKFHGPYLRHIVTADPFHAQFMNTVAGVGGSLVRARPKAAAQIKIPLPPLEEQRRIAGILDAADALRRRRREALALLDTLPGAIFAEMFGGRSNLPTARIEDVVVNGRTGPFGSQLLKSEFVASGIPVLGIDNVVTNHFVEETPRFITEEKYKALQRYTVIPGDVLITIMGTCGRCAVVPPDVPKMVNTKHLCCLTPEHEKIDSEYLRAAFLFDEDVHRQIEQQTKGSIMSGLNMGIIKGLSIKVPPILEQKTFAARLHNINTHIENCKAHSVELETLFASFQSRAFAGAL